MTEPIKFINAPISIYQSKERSRNGKPSRRVFITVSDLAAIPDELFAVKISQSRNPALAGKAVFKYFSYRLNDETPFASLAPNGTTMATPVGDLKAQVVSKFGQLPDAKFTVAINMNGAFANIKTADGTFTIFDEKEFPQTHGKPNYYVKTDTLANVEIESATSANGPYYRVKLETEASSNDVFVRAQRSRVWGAEDDAEDVAAPAEEENAGGAW